MSRYVDKQPTVSQEGFFGAVGKFLAAAGTAYSRSVTLGLPWHRHWPIHHFYPYHYRT
jgi:hypothetical protein